MTDPQDIKNKNTCPMAGQGSADGDVDYAGYLGLDRLLSSQNRISDAHDEMLFITVHQAYEIWFKQILFELDRVQSLLQHEHVRENDLRRITAGLGRIIEIIKLTTTQLDVLETMTPLDFLDFRHVFRTASGFQSVQFREIEIRLGLGADERVRYNDKDYKSYLDTVAQEKLSAQEEQSSLFDQLDDWLSRTPFLDMGEFNFWDEYQKTVTDMLAADYQNIAENTALTPDIAALEREKIKRTQNMFERFFNGAEESQKWRLSPQSLRAALFINLYRDKPALHAPFMILKQLMDIDELLALWRYRHALMVQRMLGVKMGSGGSSGHDYLIETAGKHRVFSDLFALSSYLIPRSSLPTLPDDVEKQMHFMFEAR